MTTKLSSSLVARLDHCKFVLDDEIFLSREEILRVRFSEGEDVLEQELLPAVVRFLQRHVALHGWFYPPQEEHLGEVLEQLAMLEAADFQVSSLTRAGNAYLKSHFKSFWDVDGGPVSAFFSPERLTRVVRYRLGLNQSRSYTYLCDGQKVHATETFNLSLAEIRRGFVVQRNAVSFFKPSAAVGIYKRWLHGVDSPQVWDPSCGFGARMLGFYASFPSGKYYGNEPATKTYADLRDLAAALGQSPELYACGAEHQTFKEDSLDLVFTSPPYFDLEKYYDEPGQCWKEYPTYERWTAGFLRPLMRAARHALKPSGYLILNVDVPRRDSVIQIASALGFNLLYEHNLVLRQDHYARKRGATGPRGEPILVFKKGSSTHPRWDKIRDPRGGQEVWVEWPEDPDYLISSEGRCVSLKKGQHVLQGSASSAGYVSWPMGLAHRAVLSVFDGPPSAEMEGRHLNAAKDDNRLVNLAWGSKEDNAEDTKRRKAARLPVPEVVRKAIPNRGYQVAPSLVQAGINQFEAGGTSLQGLCVLWDCSRDVAKRLLTGELYPTLTRDSARIESLLGRTGEKHHKSALTDAQVRSALNLYTQQQWSGPRFAEELGISQPTAHQILSGTTWRHLERPEGFMYPWPRAAARWAAGGSSHASAKLTEAQIQELFSRIIADEFETTKDLMLITGLTKGPMWALLRGESWSKVPRPPGFDEAVERLRVRGNKARGQRSASTPEPTVRTAPVLGSAACPHPDADEEL